jgi:thiol-disulfide isomerase/thioredoxin
MRSKVFLALGLVAVTVFSLSVAATTTARRVHSVRAARQPQTHKASSARTPAVRQINAEELRTLLQRGTKQSHPLLVNFWATWCDPCREEFPDLVQIDKDYKARGLDFVVISLDDPGDAKTAVPQFLQQMHAAMPAYLLNVADPEPSIKGVDAAWTGSLPATFLFDAQGQIAFKHTGRILPGELRAALDKTLNAGR